MTDRQLIIKWMKKDNYQITEENCSRMLSEITNYLDKFNLPNNVENLRLAYVRASIEYINKKYRYELLKLLDGEKEFE